MAPIVHGLEAENYDQINFVYLDADDPNTADYQRQFGFRVQPEFYLLDGQGNVIKKWFGSVDKAEFEAAFEEALAQ